MALKAMVDALDTVSEGVRAEYEEIKDGDNAGKFRLKVEGAEALVDTSGLRTALQKTRVQAKLADAIKKEFPDASDEEITELLKQAKAARAAGGTDPGGSGQPDLNKLRKEVEAELEKKYKPLTAERETLQAENRRLKLDQNLEKMAIDAGVMPERLADAITLVKGRFDLDEKGRIVVLDEDGELSASTAEQFWKEKLKSDKPWLYKGPDASGSGGGRGSDKQRQTGTIKSKKDIRSDKDKVAFIREHGHQAYIDLPSE